MVMMPMQTQEISLCVKAAATASHRGARSCRRLSPGMKITEQRTQ